ncbi:MAG TPA: methyltransferase domain-containing protein [Gemmatimonadaceae bacterium]
MGLIGGAVAQKFLAHYGQRLGAGRMDGGAYQGRSKIETLLGPEIWDAVRGKTVLDFGCGQGTEAIDMARHGAGHVIGLDIREEPLAIARRLAHESGVSDRCTFATATNERVDVIVALDSFEHFADPAAVLRTMHDLLVPDGLVLVSFGPTWYHPLGGHLFSVFPWAHLIFTERALIQWRSGFKADGATRFNEVDGGLNQMSIRRFRRLVRESPLTFASFEARPIRQLRWLANPWTREFTTATVRCSLVARASRDGASHDSRTS